MDGQMDDMQSQLRKTALSALHNSVSCGNKKLSYRRETARQLHMSK